MKRLSAWEAWKLLILSLPKGIGAFLFAVVGLTIGMASSVVIIGLPLLAFVLIVCRWMLDSEREQTTAWLNGRKPSNQAMSDGIGSPRGQQGLKSLFAVFADGRSYRGIVYCMLQLPAGLISFTLAIVLPAVALAVTLSPAAWFFIKGQYGYELYADGWLFEWIGRTFGLTPYDQSWIIAGFGLLLALLVPATVRMLGRFYAAWIDGIAGIEPAAAAADARAGQEPPAGEQTNLPDDIVPELPPLRLELERLEQRLAADASRS